MSVGAILFICIGLVGSTGATAPPIAEAQTTQSADVDADDATTDLHDANGTVEALVVFDHNTSGDDVVTLQTQAADSQAEFVQFVDETDGIDLKRQFWITSAILVEIDTDTVSIEALRGEHGVDDILPNTNLDTHTTSTVDSLGQSEANMLSRTDEMQSKSVDTDSTATYGIGMIRAPDVWDHYGTGTDMTVAVLDTGVDPDHPDVDLYTENESDPTYPGGWAEFDSDAQQIDGSEPFDGNGHGTHVSATVTGGNASGTQIGVAPDARLLHARVADDQGEGTIAQAIAGMEWAVENNADLLTMSFGSPSTSVWISAVENARSADVVVVSSIGNSGDETSSSPGNLYSTIGVGALDSDESVASFSSGEHIITDDRWGDDAPDDWPDEYVVPRVTAPGVDVLSAIPGDEWDTRQGTSMAAPHVAGTIALMGQSAPADEFTPDAVNAALTATVRHPGNGPDTRYGHGIVDAFAATMYTHADGAISGTVTDPDGDPIHGATVSANGAETSTDENGSYTLVTDSTDAIPITVDRPGYSTNTTTISVERGEYQHHDVVIEPTFEFEVLSEPPAEITAGESIEYRVRVSNLESVSVTPTGGSVDVDGLSLSIDGDDASFVDPVEFDRISADEFVITIATSPGTVGTFEFLNEFSGVNESVRRSYTVSVRPDRPAITVPDQTTDGTAVRIGATYHDEEFAVALLNDTDSDTDTPIGMSTTLSAETIHQNVIVRPDEPISENTSIEARLYVENESVEYEDVVINDTASLSIVSAHESGVFFSVFYAVTGGEQTLRGGHLTVSRGAVIDGEPRDGVQIRGRDLTLLRGYMLDR